MQTSAKADEKKFPKSFRSMPDRENDVTDVIVHFWASFAM